MAEEWRPVVGYEGLYEVSNWGALRSLDRVKTNPIAGEHIVKGKVLNPVKNQKGYLRFILWKDGKKFSAGVHRLVAAAFIPNLHNYPEINHKDGLKDNNYLGNLEWCTTKENIKHSYVTGLRALDHAQGEKNGRSKLSSKQVKEIRNMGNTIRQIDLAELYGVSQLTISKILNRKLWTHI